MPSDDEGLSTINIFKWRNGSFLREDDVVAKELHVTYHVEPLGILRIVMSPMEFKEFILGHLFSEGIIESAEQIVSFTIADRKDSKEILVELEIESLSDDLQNLDSETLGCRPLWMGQIQTSCANGVSPVMARPLEAIKRPLKISVDDLLNVPVIIRERSELFHRTGAFHYAFLLDDRMVPRFAAYDIGRHTAVDKSIGKALLAMDGMDSEDEDFNFADTILYTTGRISSDVVRKCLRSRIPWVVSRGAPLKGAIYLASKYDLGMVGFLRGGRFNVYSGKEHIVRD